MLRAGELRHQVTIQRRIETQDVGGAMLVSWEDVATVWAQIAPLSAREYLQSAALQSEITARIKIRHRPGLDATMRIVHGEKIYNPAAWLPDAESGIEYLTAPCSEGVNDG